MGVRRLLADRPVLRIRYLLRAAVELLLARLRYARLSASELLTALEAPPPPTPAKRPVDLPMMTWAIAAVAARVPWRSDCMMRAVAADHWLRRLGHRPEFRLGVAKLGDTFSAHAWLSCDGVMVTGASPRTFSVLVRPASGPELTR